MTVTSLQEQAFSNLETSASQLDAHLHNPDQFLHTEEGDDATKHSKANRHVVGIMSTISTMAKVII